jgi:hypothetical protein
MPHMFAANVRHLTQAADAHHKQAATLGAVGGLLFGLSLMAFFLRPDAMAGGCLAFLAVAFFLFAGHAQQTARLEQRHAGELNLMLTQFKSCGDIVERGLRY